MIIIDLFIIASITYIINIIIQKISVRSVKTPHYTVISKKGTIEVHPNHVH